MRPLIDEQPIVIDVRWTRLRLYERLIDEDCEHDEDANLYMIARRFGNAEAKIIYIGKTWQQWVSRRLRQQDHQQRLRRWRKDYPRQSLWVSHGVLTVPNGNVTQKRLDVAERLLTYACSLDHTENRRNIFSHQLKDPYLVRSSGSRLSLPRTVRLGVTISNKL